jgi:hypothetical protein
MRALVQNAGYELHKRECEVRAQRTALTTLKALAPENVRGLIQEAMQEVETAGDCLHRAMLLLDRVREVVPYDDEESPAAQLRAAARNFMWHICKDEAAYSCQLCLNRPKCRHYITCNGEDFLPIGEVQK